MSVVKRAVSGNVAKALARARVFGGHAANATSVPTNAASVAAVASVATATSVKTKPATSVATAASTPSVTSGAASTSVAISSLVPTVEVRSKHKIAVDTMAPALAQAVVNGATFPEGLKLSDGRRAPTKNDYSGMSEEAKSAAKAQNRKDRDRKDKKESDQIRIEVC